MTLIQKIKNLFRRNKVKLADTKETVDTLVQMVIDLRKVADDHEKAILECIDNNEKYEEFGRLIAHAFKVIEERLTNVEQIAFYLVEQNKVNSARIEILEDQESARALADFEQTASQDSEAN